MKHLPLTLLLLLPSCDDGADKIQADTIRELNVRTEKTRAAQREAAKAESRALSAQARCEELAKRVSALEVKAAHHRQARINDRKIFEAEWNLREISGRDEPFPPRLKASVIQD